MACPEFEDLILDYCEGAASAAMVRCWNRI